RIERLTRVEYCPRGYYCTNAGCCPNGTPLAQCGATVSLSVIPPPAGTAATSAPATKPAAPATTSSAAPTVTRPSNGTATTSRPVQVGAGQKPGINVPAALGGLGALLMAL